MKVEVDVISEENIEPSSPTPTHLCHYWLSFLNQIMTSVYISSICFYNKTDAYSKFSNETAKSSVLKKSLSDVLKCYYPLTGCVKDNLIVDCNDEGVLYLEAQVKCQLSNIVADPNLVELKKFLPCDIDGAHHLAFAVQVNYFTCGGIAICACISHKIADGSSFSTFLKNWAATSRGECKIYLQFQSPILFPPITYLSGIGSKAIMTK